MFYWFKDLCARVEEVTNSDYSLIFKAYVIFSERGKVFVINFFI